MLALGRAMESYRLIVSFLYYKNLFSNSMQDPRRPLTAVTLAGATSRAPFIGLELPRTFCARVQSPARWQRRRAAASAPVAAEASRRARRDTPSALTPGPRSSRVRVITDNGQLSFIGSLSMA